MKHIENQLDRSIKNTDKRVIYVIVKLNFYSVNQIFQILDDKDEERLSLLNKIVEHFAFTMKMLEMSSIVEVAHWL